MFVLGADHDTPDAMRETVKFAQKNKIDTVMLNILTPLPGTQQFQELEAEGRIIEHDWSFYDAQHVVFQPKQMTPLHLLQETIKANKRFYATWRPVWAWHKWLWTGETRAVRARRRSGTACSSTAGSGTTRAPGGRTPRTGRSASGSVC